MKTKKIIFLSAISVATLGLVAVSASINDRIQSNPSFADQTYTETVLDANELEKCSLSAYQFDGKNDSKQFTYSLEGGKYIEGAVLYGDCDYQSAGSDLSKPFVMNNSGQTVDNASNFHFMFSAHGIIYASFTFDIELDELPTDPVDFSYGAKLSTKCGAGLYEGLRDRHYYGGTENPKQGVADTVNSSGFYEAGGSENTQFTTSEKKLENKTHYYELNPQAEIDSLNAVAFQVNTYHVPAGRTLSITLKSVTLRYTCK